MAPTFKLMNVVIDTNDLRGLADFYCKLLDCEVVFELDYYLQLNGPDGGVTIGIQLDESFVRPSWPDSEGKQGQMAHLDFEVENVAEAQQFAESLGAVKAEAQYIDGMGGVTLLDPSGHPFCLMPKDQQ